MVPAPDPMGAPSSLTARRPNASNLPTFELPPPPLAGLQHKYSSYSPLTSSHSAPTATTLTSVGNLLTPPSNASGDGLSPGSSGVPTTASLSHHGSVQPFTPGSSGMWQTSSASTPYGFQSSSTPGSYSQGRGGLFSPSLNSIVRGTSSPTASEGLPPPPYEMSQYSASMPMSASSMSSTQGQPQMMGSGMMGNHNGHVSHSSPVHAQESFTRLPPTPTYHTVSQPTTAPQQAAFSYSTGPSPMHYSPISTGGPLSKMSPMSHPGSIPPLQAQPQQYSQQRSYSYHMPGPVLSNVGNPGGQLALVGGGVPPGMVPQFSSGQLAHMQHLYGHHHQQPNPQNDRPFRCDQCPQSFNRNHDLKRHKRIHLAVKPFPCGHCDKSFSRKDALKRHVLVKGCGKAQTTTEVKELEGSSSPEPHSESVGTSPVVSSNN